MEKKENGFLLVINKLFPTKRIKLIASLVVIVAIAVACIFIFAKNDKQSVDTRYMVTLLTKSSELTTAKLNYTGMTKFTDSGVAFVNKSDFIMVYNATARIGIDLENVNVYADDSKQIVYVEIPAVQVQEVKVDANSIQYFDTKFSLFNIDQKEDGNKAIALAEEKAALEIQNMGVLQMAQDQSATLIKGILANAIPDGYTIEIKQK